MQQTSENCMIMYTLKTSISLTAFRGLNAWNQKPFPGANMPGIRAFLICLDSVIPEGKSEIHKNCFFDILLLSQLSQICTTQMNIANQTLNICLMKTDDTSVIITILLNGLRLRIYGYLLNYHKNYGKFFTKNSVWVLKI